MNETFLSYLWKYRQISQDLLTESGDPIAVIYPGDQNSDSGPDFFNARLRIGATTWAGNVEIHVRASDWYKHGHHADPAYDHVILHVVYEADRQVCHLNGEPMQTLVLHDRFPAGIFNRYLQMMQNQQWIPCMNQLKGFTANAFRLWAPALAVERLGERSISIREVFNGSGHDWEETAYRHMAGSFGFSINALPFSLLARSLPLKIIRQHLHDPFQLEALLFGQAGMLEKTFIDEYPIGLQMEYCFLRAKYHLDPISGSIWKFLRLRPSNFPTVRISQFAGFLRRMHPGFFNLPEQGTLSDATEMLSVEATEYWSTHYVFDKPAGFRPKLVGQGCANLLIVNGIIPFFFFYGQEKDMPPMCERMLNFLENISGEHNSMISQWKSVGFPTENALQSQALIQLKRCYCDRKRCLECRVGEELLSWPAQPGFQEGGEL
jgi:hypothetical protein